MEAFFKLFFMSIKREKKMFQSPRVLFGECGTSWQLRVVVWARYEVMPTSSKHMQLVGMHAGSLAHPIGL